MLIAWTRLIAFAFFKYRFVPSAPVPLVPCSYRRTEITIPLKIGTNGSRSQPNGCVLHIYLIGVNYVIKIEINIFRILVCAAEQALPAGDGNARFTICVYIKLRKMCSENSVDKNEFVWELTVSSRRFSQNCKYHSSTDQFRLVQLADQQLNIENIWIWIWCSTRFRSQCERNWFDCSFDFDGFIISIRWWKWWNKKSI